MKAKITLQMRAHHPRRVLTIPAIRHLRAAFLQWREQRWRRQAHEQALAHLRSLPAYLREDVGIPIANAPDQERITKYDASHEKHSLY